MVFFETETVKVDGLISDFKTKENANPDVAIPRNDTPEPPKPEPVEDVIPEVGDIDVDIEQEFKDFLEQEDEPVEAVVPQRKVVYVKEKPKTVVKKEVKKVKDKVRSRRSNRSAKFDLGKLINISGLALLGYVLFS